MCTQKNEIEWDFHIIHCIRDGLNRVLLKKHFCHHTTAVLSGPFNVRISVMFFSFVLLIRKVLICS